MTWVRGNCCAANGSMVVSFPEHNAAHISVRAAGDVCKQLAA
jgi:hypothetical protein